MEPLTKKHHAKLINNYAPETTERCLSSQDPERAMREQVEDMCYKAGVPYALVIQMADTRDDAALRRIFRNSEYTTSPVSAARSAPSIVLGHPAPKSPAGTHPTPGAMSDPGRATTQNPLGKAEWGTISRICRDDSLERQPCTILPSHTQYSFIGAEVLARFSDKPSGDICEALRIPYLADIGPIYSDRRIKLTWCVNGHAKTNQGIFYVLDEEMPADILTTAPKVGIRDHAAKINQPLPQRHFMHGMDGLQADSNHISSDYSPHSSPRSQPELPLSLSMKSMGLPGDLSSSSTTPRGPPTAINISLPDQTGQSSSAPRPKLRHFHLSSNKSELLDMNDTNGAKYLQSVTKFYYEATDRKQRFDRSLHSLHINHVLKDGSKGEKYIYSTREDSFAELWPDFLDFIKRGMPESREFSVEIVDDNDSG